MFILPKSIAFKDVYLVLVPDEVANLQFDDISDRAVRVSWLPPKKSNGILVAYRLSYQVKDDNNTYKEEILPANVTSIRIEHLQVFYYEIYFKNE